ncbi:MAG: hypothetical protein FJZ95_04230 [Chloroflexi bacterium]|nr:hypothetical protein [Chloroflexota bacterium]
MLRVLALTIIAVIVISGLAIGLLQGGSSKKIETWSRGSDWPEPGADVPYSPTPGEAQSIEAAVRGFFEALDLHDAEAFDQLLMSKPGGYWWTMFYKAKAQELTFTVEAVEIAVMGSGRCETDVTMTVTSTSSRVTITEPTHTERMQLVLKDSRWLVVDPAYDTP